MATLATLDYKHREGRDRKMRLTPNTLPAFHFEGNWAPLPMHVFNVATRRCVHCGEGVTFKDFEDYVDWYMDFEYEGQRLDPEKMRDDFEKTHALCIATPDWFN